MSKPSSKPKEKKDDLDFPEMKLVIKGPCQFPKLIKPDFRFDEEKGDYQVRIVLDEESAYCKELQKRISDLHDETIEFVQENFEKEIKKAGGQLKDAGVPFRLDRDKEGDPTGLVAFTGKCKGAYKDDDGELKAIELPLFDSRGVPWDRKIEIGGGSVLQVSLLMRGFYVASIGAGVSSRIRAVVVQEHKAKYDKNDPSSYGFDFDNLPAELEAEGQEAEVESDEDETPKKSKSKSKAPEKSEDGDF